jgi:hypothetical protein
MNSPRLHPSFDLHRSNLLHNRSIVHRIQERPVKLKLPALRSTFAVAVLAALFPFYAISTSSARPLAQSSPQAASPCSFPEYRQFDFWLGDWDAFDATTNAKDSRVRITRILDGCVVHEDYQSVDGHKGESFSIYDASRKVWHQTWVTNRGRLLIVEGQFENGTMVLSGADHTENGHERLVRGLWKLENGGVRETAFTSLDGGKTWKPWFDLLFRPHKSAV